MKFFVAFAAVLACAFASPSAYSAYSPYSYGYAPYGYGYSSYAHAAPVTVLPSGYLADTPEVAHAKAAHLAEKAKVASYAAPAYAHGSYGYPYASYASAYAHAPAQITVLPSGYLADTPEVAHAKGAHEVATSHVAAAAAANPDYSEYAHAPAYSGAYYASPYVYSGAYSAPYYGSYNGHYAKPVVTSSGYLADTPEVAHAKAAHLAVKAAASSYAHHY